MFLFPASPASKFDPSKQPKKSILKQSQSKGQEQRHVSWLEEEVPPIKSYHTVPTRKANKRNEAMVYKEAIAADRKIHTAFPKVILQQHHELITERLYQHYQQWYTNFLNRRHQYSYKYTDEKTKRRIEIKGKKVYWHHQAMQELDNKRNPSNKDKGLAAEFGKKYDEKKEGLACIDITSMLDFLRKELKGDLKIQILTYVLANDISKTIDWPNIKLNQKVGETANKFSDEICQNIPDIPLQKEQLVQGMLTVHAQQADDYFQQALYSSAHMILLEPDQYTFYHELIKREAKELLLDERIQACVDFSNHLQHIIYYLASQKKLFFGTIENALKQQDKKLNKNLLSIRKEITKCCQGLPDLKHRVDELYQNFLNEKLSLYRFKDYFASRRIQDNAPTVENIAKIITPAMNELLAESLKDGVCRNYVANIYRVELNDYLKTIDSDIQAYIDKHDYWQDIQKLIEDPKKLKNQISETIQMNLARSIQRKNDMAVPVSKEDIQKYITEDCDKRLKYHYDDCINFEKVQNYISAHVFWSVIEKHADDIEMLRDDIVDVVMNRLGEFVKSNREVSLEQQEAVWTVHCDEQLKYYHDYYINCEKIQEYMFTHQFWSDIEKNALDIEELKKDITDTVTDNLEKFVKANPQASLEQQEAVWKVYCDEELRSEYEACVRSVESSSKPELSSSIHRLNLAENPVQQTTDDQQMPLSEVKDASEQTEAPSLT